MGYNYNTIDKITSNPIEYNINAPDVVNYLRNQLHDSRPSTAAVAAALTNKTITDSYTYDNLGRMTSADIYGICPELTYNTSGSPVVLQRHQALSFSTIDANGNPQAKTTTDYGTDTTTTSETDGLNYLNQLTSQTVTGKQGHTAGFVYDYNGNMTAENYSGETVTRNNSQFIYGLDNQLLWSTTDSAHQRVNGTDCYNRTVKENTYELDGKLLRVKSDISDSTNPYDKWTVGYNDYFYYSHDGVITERHDDVSKFKYFTRLGRELLTCNTSDNGTYFYIQNLRGDVMMLVKSDGNVSSIRDYDASGQMLAQAPDTRTDRDPFGFIGGLDAGSGLYKLGARFYNSSNGGFIQQDRYMGDPGDPLSLNRYVYCRLDPMNFIDPTGFDVSAPGCDGHGENSGYNVSQSVTHNSDGSFSTSYTYHSSDGSSHQSTYGFSSQGNKTYSSNTTTSGFSSKTETTFYNITVDQADVINKSKNCETLGYGTVFTAFGFAEGFAYISAVVTTGIGVASVYSKGVSSGDSVTYSSETNGITTISGMSVNGESKHGSSSSSMHVMGWN